ncbi:hypothetical protein [Burkholderia ubonensis]|uniref:hypothetical protein n=1 Tax=Burkholderia ubonensis TaxID=101571 RepID=UPI0012F86B9D|nr:hypothetical protein [Burkholderia ubonensis]
MSSGKCKKQRVRCICVGKKSRIFIENGTVEYPLVLDFYRPTKDGCEKTEFARYSIEGGAPTVESIFFMLLRDHVNVFSIVAWDISNRGDGTHGRLYRVLELDDAAGKPVDKNGNPKDQGWYGLPAKKPVRPFVENRWKVLSES